MYLQSTISTTTNDSYSWSTNVAPYWYEYENVYGSNYGGERGGQYSADYNAKNEQDADWNTGAIVSNLYSGSYTISSSSFDSCLEDRWWCLPNDPPGFAKWADITNTANDSFNLTTNGWVGKNTSSGCTYIYYRYDTPQTDFLDCSSYDSGVYTNPPPTVAMMPTLIELKQTKMVFTNTDCTGNAMGVTVCTLDNEYTTDALRGHTLDDLKKLSLDDGSPDLRLGNQAVFNLSLDERSLSLRKARYIFGYDTDINTEYLITREFTVWTNGVLYPVNITVTNVVAGTGGFVIENDYIQVESGLSLVYEGPGGPVTLVTEFFTGGSHIYLGQARLSRVTIERYLGCSSCGQHNSSASSADLSLAHSADLDFNLGVCAYGQPSGTFGFSAEGFTANLYSPSSLSLLAVTSNVTPVYDSSGALRQVGAAQCLADIVVKNPGRGYQVVFYSVNALMPFHDNQTPIPTNNLPVLATWTVENPDSNSSNRLRIVEMRGGTPITNLLAWNGSLSQWTLLAGNNTRQDTVADNLSPDGRTSTRTRSTSDPNTGRVLSQSQDTYYFFDCGRRLVQHSEGSSAVARTTTYT
jgi:hypothetical protein